MPILYLLRVHLKYKCFKNFCSISNDHVGSVEWFTEHLMPFWKTHLAEGSYYLRERSGWQTLQLLVISILLFLLHHQ